MKKTLITLASAAALTLGAQAMAAGDAEIGKKIYDRAFGRGCGACHDISSNPQLRELIAAGQLDRESFGKVLKEGRNGMPKAMEQIMKIGPVKKAGLTEEQAIDAVYEFLSK
ncbi:MAG: cytochrome c [Methylococcales bacterium]|nr:cytochrome c [Methylococcales bacterium]